MEGWLSVIKSEETLIRLLQISDLHFGPPYVEKAGAAALRSAAELKPDAVIISGDLTQRAKRVQFEAAKNFLAGLPPVPQLVVPGNHDVPLYRFYERVTDPHGLYREIISKELNPVLEIKGALIAGIDSTSPHTAISNGRIDEWQLDHLGTVFRKSPGELIRVVVAHHPFAPAHDFLRDKIVQKAKRAIEKFTDLDVELILSGHLHRAYIGNSLDFYPGTHRDRGIIIGHCGTTTSRRGRGREAEKNTLNLIEICRTTIRIMHYMYFDESDTFELTSEHTFRRRSLTSGIGSV